MKIVRILYWIFLSLATLILVFLFAYVFAARNLDNGSGEVAEIFMIGGLNFLLSGLLFLLLLFHFLLFRLKYIYWPALGLLLSIFVLPYFYQWILNQRSLIN